MAGIVGETQHVMANMTEPFGHGFALSAGRGTPALTLIFVARTETEAAEKKMRCIFESATAVVWPPQPQ